MFRIFLAGLLTLGGLLPAAGFAQTAFSPDSPTLTLEQALGGEGLAPAALEEARLAADLAAFEAELRGSHGFLRDLPELSTRVGYRRFAGNGSADAELEIDLPLATAAGRESRRALEEGLARATPLLRRAARHERERRVAEAFLAAWSAQRRRELRGDDLRLLEDFSGLLREQIAAGAVAAYQADLAAAELQAARGQLAEADAELQASWAELALLAGRPLSPLPRLAPPAWPAAAAGGRTLAAAALEAEARLADAAGSYRLERELARSSLTGSVAKEGDDEVALFGWRWRLGLPGREAALEAEQARQRELRGQQARLRLVELEARRQRSLALLAALPAVSAEEAPSSWQAAWQAVELRVREGKDSPAEALAIRRTLIAARTTQLDLELRRLRAQADLRYLDHTAVDQEPRP